MFGREAGFFSVGYRIIGNQRERGIEWAVSRFPVFPGTWDTASALIQEKDGGIIACVVYNHWYPANSVEMSIAAVDGERWLNRPFLFAAFGNPFLNWNMRRVSCRTSADNAKAIKLGLHLGFVPEGRIREGYAAGVDMLTFGMLKSECRFLGEDFGKPIRQYESHREILREGIGGAQ